MIGSNNDRYELNKKFLNNFKLKKLQFKDVVVATKSERDYLINNREIFKEKFYKDKLANLDNFLLEASLHVDMFNLMIKELERRIKWVEESEGILVELDGEWVEIDKFEE